jgi:DNA-directed RNA polymerase specialized sigma24 family protein
VADAANDALLACVQHPDRYDPHRLPLLNYLTLLADRRLVDLLRRRARESERLEFVGGLVELAAAESKYIHEDTGELGDPDRLPPEIEAWVAETLPDPKDRAFVDRMCAGEHSTEAFAAVLGLAGLPEKERAAAVKRNRDRILKRLQRRREALRASWRCDDD